MADQVRSRVLDALIEVAINGRSASDMERIFSKLEGPDRGLAKELFMGSLHQYYLLEAIARRWLARPFKSRDKDLLLIIILGLYQLWFSRIPDHAAINETVDLCEHRNKAWAKNTINALLRRAQRESEAWRSINLQPNQIANLPTWLYEQLRLDWGSEAEALFTASHQRAPLTLRVNRLQITVADYLTLLDKAGVAYQKHPYVETAIRLTQGMDVTALPGYDQGFFSIQDASAQCAAEIVAPQNGELILDACAAPGGKTAHLIEQSQGTAHVVALDQAVSRLERLEDNLQRLQLQAEIRCGDATNTSDWSEDNEQFDRILCDAPCSATGIIRRHPDIALHRTAKDLRQLKQLQWRILKSLWAKLKPGGTFVYSTCSMLKVENETMVGDFLTQNSDAQLQGFTVGNGQIQTSGTWQIKTGQDDMDGFFYAKWIKKL